MGKPSSPKLVDAGSNPVDPARELIMDKKEFKIERFRAGGNGGQNVNKVETAVRITHLPTGLKAQSQDERSQAQNMKRAMDALFERIEKHKALQKRLEKARLKAEMNTGRVRTYNLVSNQVTDNIRNVKVMGARDILEGKLDLIFIHP